ncbi:5-methyltetrahydropteroyltriglutamate--homocysteine S-methyltransferase [Methylocella sp. CPCC 101449]|uniref:5-methyltetrahydropteroyltriglutamate-- homocysteine S-methyltransferase n=1 Tax=Methylocella sp. CPCC 101449 TaxID=2987531 RepID=UPI00289160A8|nr:5-methyltetrahydropteroyltriglutamate--homocysteine S-methyltransferase [Methylocella sp. CPCC 101449]MDT2024184.1 5-methyltetrahydropteroyltriglutamate--homocysteine S-methyltransferase [Methylocella sp. CPCC 101449]
MQRKIPPFRADHVGSILRTAPLKEARAKKLKGEITADQLKAVEDEEIKKIIAKQEEVGLHAITDGEFRRSWWHYDFLSQLDGVKLAEVETGIKFTGVTTKAEAPYVYAKLGSKHHPHIEHFKFVKEHTKRTPKMSIPSPSMLHYRGGSKMVDSKVYPKFEDFWHDLGLAYREAIKGFYDAGCRYLQIDDCSMAYFCDDKQRQMLIERGDDPDQLEKLYAQTLNTALEGRPSDMAITMHVCRGNFRSTFIASGGYEHIADLMFNKINLDGYFLEWDNDRSGDLAPLRHLPKNKTVVVGLVTSKTGEMEDKDQIKRRLEEASKYTDIEQLCLSPQCGFASTEEGNSITEQQQWDKLRMVVEVAEEVWGKA